MSNDPAIAFTCVNSPGPDMPESRKSIFFHTKDPIFAINNQFSPVPLTRTDNQTGLQLHGSEPSGSPGAENNIGRGTRSAPPKGTHKNRRAEIRTLSSEATVPLCQSHFVPSGNPGSAQAGFQFGNEDFFVLARKPRDCAEAYSRMSHKQTRWLTPSGRNKTISGWKLQNPPWKRRLPGCVQPGHCAA